MWDRADVLFGLILCEFYVGHFARCDELLPELEAAAGRAGHHGALWVHERVQHGLELARTGDIRQYPGVFNAGACRTDLRYVSRSTVGVSQLLLGAVDRALEHLTTVIHEQPVDNWLRGLPEANLFMATALAGRHDDARALIPTVAAWLPVSGRRNKQGSYCALNGLITGLTLVGDREQCGGLSPWRSTTRALARWSRRSCWAPIRSLRRPWLPMRPGWPTGRASISRIALRQARDVPIRFLQPIILDWYGRVLSTAGAVADRSRGRAMVEASLADFRTLGMVLHADLAEQFLRARG